MIDLTHPRYTWALLRTGIICMLTLALPVRAETPLRDLSATGWQLVEIQSMDDTVYAPESGTRYRLHFGVDGSVAVEADCNRASGSISVFDPPRLQFSDLGTTLAFCGPASISERFLSELGWVRSYVYRDGHLYLATMADGSIIEFAPLPAVEATATVGPLALVTDDLDTLRGVVLARLLDDYAQRNGISASEAEIDSHLARMQRRLREELGDDYDSGASLNTDERVEVERMRRAMARSIIRSWKVNAALHREYGGRIIYQQLGPEPLDAYLALLEAAQASGQFHINRAELEAPFWTFFRDEQRHDFMPPGGEDEARSFAIPPWAGQE